MSIGETKELLENILEYCQENYYLPVPEIDIEFKDVERSQVTYYNGRTVQYTIIIALFWFKNETKAVASLLHEIAHVYQYVQDGYFSHDKKFKKCEQELLNAFGLRAIKYDGAYYSKLETINGKHIAIWER